jgi:Protein of unknown function (DUF2971)
MRFPANPVCHYTSVDALLQMTITEKLVIEASHIASFEDISEGNVVINTASDRLVAIAAEIDRTNGTRREFELQMKLHAESMRKSQIEREAYVLSLSEAVDSLPMWRLYAAGGAGICLVFDTEKLQELVTKQWEGDFQPIDYSGLHKREVKSLEDAVFEDWRLGPYLKCSPHYDPDRATSATILKWLECRADQFQQLVNRRSLFCKSNGFEFEREIRAVFDAPSSADSRIVFRGGTRAPIARLRLSISEDMVGDVLKRIILAPGLDALSPVSQQRVNALVKTFKSRKKSFKNVEFESSAIPFYSSYGR